MSTEVEKKLHLARYGFLHEIHSQERKYTADMTPLILLQETFQHIDYPIVIYTELLYRELFIHINRIEVQFSCTYLSEILLLNDQEISFTC